MYNNNWWIIILILLFFGCGNYSFNGCCGNSCGNNCGCGCGCNNSCGNNCNCGSNSCNNSCNNCGCNCCCDNKRFYSSFVCFHRYVPAFLCVYLFSDRACNADGVTFCRVERCKALRPVIIFFHFYGPFLPDIL